MQTNSLITRLEIKFEWIKSQFSQYPVFRLQCKYTFCFHCKKIFWGFFFLGGSATDPKAGWVLEIHNYLLLISSDVKVIKKNLSYLTFIKSHNLVRNVIKFKAVKRKKNELSYIKRGQNINLHSDLCTITSLKLNSDLNFKQECNVVQLLNFVFYFWKWWEDS